MTHETRLDPSLFEHPACPGCCPCCAELARLKDRNTGHGNPLGGFNPGPAPHNGTETSRLAAGQVGDRRPIHERIVALLQQRPQTCGELEAQLVGTHQGISARVRELVIGGVIEDTGHTRANPVTGRRARIYRIAR